MISILFQILVGIFGGLAGSLQTTINGILSNKVGDLASVCITYGTGGIIIFLITVLSGNLNIKEWQTLPWYLFLPGILGLVIVGALGYTSGRLGTTAAMSIFIVASLTFGTIIDHFGLLGTAQRPMDISRLIGLTALIIGTWLVTR